MVSRPPSARSVRCSSCGSTAMMLRTVPGGLRDVVCADCGARFGSFAEFVELAEEEAVKALLQALGPGA